MTNKEVSTTKFIEVTDRGDHTKRLINVDVILSVIEDTNGLAFIEVFGSDDGGTAFGVACAEKYIDIYNSFATFEYVAF